MQRHLHTQAENPIVSNNIEIFNLLASGQGSVVTRRRRISRNEIRVRDST